MKSSVNENLKVFVCCVLFTSLAYATNLIFQTPHGSNVRISPNGTTAYRVNQSFCCNAGVVTNHVLELGVLFEVRIDTLIEGRSSINIGATTGSAEYFRRSGFPLFMYQMRPWNCIIWSTHVVLNGTTIDDNYGPDLLDVKEGDRIGVKRVSRDLHMYYNGNDQGPACRNVPDSLYGLVDIIDQTVQVSIVSPPPVESKRTKGGSRRGGRERILSGSYRNDHYGSQGR